jgi:hypothetical protein
MKNFVIGLALALTSFTASAIPFRGAYEVDVNSVDPGLVVTATPSSGLLSFDIADGGQTGWLPLFEIWTNETTVNSDDLAPIDASILFTFTEPVAFGGTSTGETQGVSKFFGLFQYGQLIWDNDGHNALSFPGGVLDVYLRDATFGTSLAGLSRASATVSAQFRFRSTGVIRVAEPATLTLLGAGLLLLAFARAKRRQPTQR